MTNEPLTPTEQLYALAFVGCILVAMGAVGYVSGRLEKRDKEARGR